VHAAKRKKEKNQKREGECFRSAGNAHCGRGENEAGGGSLWGRKALPPIIEEL